MFTKNRQKNGIFGPLLDKELPTKGVKSIRQISDTFVKLLKSAICYKKNHDEPSCTAQYNRV